MDRYNIKYIIEIEGLNDFSIEKKLQKKQLSGLTFIAPLEKDIKILFQNKDIEYKIIRTSDVQYAKIIMNHVKWPF